MEWLKQFARLFGWKNRQFETLTEATVEGRKVRVWRTAENLQEAQRFDHGAFAGRIRSEIAGYHGSKWTARLMALPRVACVAIVDADGNGVSAYPDWH